MKTYLTLLIIIGFVCIGRHAFSQDIHFSQFYMAPLTLNPANTGNFNGDWRVSDIYRKQWFAMDFPFETNAFGFETHFYIKKEMISVGINVINDFSGDINMSVNKIYLSGGYFKTKKKSSYHIGIQAGLVMKSFSYDGITFPDQYDHGSGVYDPDKDTEEPGTGDQCQYLDINAGILWNKKVGKFKPELGFAIFHLNQPDESFYDEGNSLPFRQVYHAGAKIDFGKRAFIHPYFLYMNHTTASELVAGTNIGLNIRKHKKTGSEVYIGGFYRSGFGRNADAAIITAGLKLGKIDFGIGYDITVSDLNKISNNNGAIELSFIYRHSSFKFNQMTIPCDRY